MERMNRHSSTPSLTRRAFVAGAGLGAAGLAGCSSAAQETSATSSSSTEATALGTNPDDAESLALDMAAWSFDETNDIYYQIGVPYCTEPQADSYESMGIYVPRAYFDATANGDGTYTCSVSASGTCGSYTAADAPVIIPINTAGYSAQQAPSSYSAQGLTDYLSAGLIYVYPGARGRNNGENDDGTSFAGGAPWGVTDFKAAIRCLRYNAQSIPGGAERIFTFGHSGGGAQSALVGTTGDSSLYAPYLSSIGALFCDRDGNALSDATTGAMCWCPITSLDIADEAYEWMMGQFASTGTRTDGTWTKEFSDDMAEKFADYINTLGLVGSDGATLELSEGGEGLYTSGSYYEKVIETIEESLNNFLADTEFPYTPDSTTMADGGFGGGGAGGSAPTGEAPSGSTEGGPSEGGSAPTGEAPSGDAPSGSSGAAQESAPQGGMGTTSSSSDATTYETVSDYISSLNEDTEWVTYSESTNTATISGLSAFVSHCKTPTKDVGAFDELDRGAAENYLFGNAETDNLHFDALMAELLAEHADEYAALSDFDESYVSAYEGDLDNADDLGNKSAVRQNMYNPPCQKS